MHPSEDYTLMLICSNLMAYASMCEGLCHSPLCEAEMPVSVASQDYQVLKFLRQELGWSEGKGVPVSDWVMRLTEAFPPPFRHRDLLAKRFDASERKVERLIRQDGQARQSERLEVTLTLKSPEQMPLAPQEILEFIDDNYRPLIMQYAGHEEALPDDFATTRELLAGEPEIILPQHRQLRITLPFRDITNSVRVLELLPWQERSLYMPQGAEDVWLLPLEVAHQEYLHLYCLVLSDVCRRFKGLDWTLLPTQI